MDEHVLAPDLDAFHPDKGAFKQGSREKHGVLVAKTFGDEQAVTGTFIIEQIEAVGHARRHYRFSISWENTAGSTDVRERRNIIPVVPRRGRAPLRPRKRCDRSARSR